jgi:hypothetical protein
MLTALDLTESHIYSMNYRSYKRSPRQKKIWLNPLLYRGISPFLAKNLPASGLVPDLFNQKKTILGAIVLILDHKNKAGLKTKKYVYPYRELYN